jgi:hypothetical protein
MSILSVLSKTLYAFIPEKTKPADDAVIAVIAPQAAKAVPANGGFKIVKIKKAR